MKRAFKIVLTLGLATGLCSCASRKASQADNGARYYYAPSQSVYTGVPPFAPAQAGTPAWPRLIVSGATTNLLYEPRVDSWDGHQLLARSAVSIQSHGGAQPVFGVVTLRAVTLVNKATRTVALEDVQVLTGDFPSTRQQTQEYLRELRAGFPKRLQSLPLDELESSFAATPQQLTGSGQRLNNTPPRIIFSTRPAVLVYIDGPPVFRTVTGTHLQRVINSSFLLLKDQTGQLYLRSPDGYLQAPKLEGPWTVASKLPPGVTIADQEAAAPVAPFAPSPGLEHSITNKPALLTASNAPAIYISTTPAELILFEGEPNFVPVPGTHLLYAANTTGNVFKLLSDQQTYVLLSGRWFRAGSLKGPWQYVAADHLPADFANIPDSSPKENVKASVPGTPQATEALIANSIPESAKVPRNTPMQDPHIDGPARLAPIAGTPLYYVVNSGTPILKVDEHSWYACQNGVWFAAPSLRGPWTVAASVPGVIYTIPPSSPLHYLTYVRVYGATPEEVYTGYTPGYLGTEVEDGAVVYGTGYDYPPWVGDVWYGWPCTWGFGWGPCWNPWDDWCFAVGFGWGCGFGPFGWDRCHPPGPWWGPARDWHHPGVFPGWRPGAPANTAGNLYAGRSSGPGNSFRPSPGAAALASGYGHAYNSRTGALAAGQRASVRSVYTGLTARGVAGSGWSAGRWAGSNSAREARYGSLSGPGLRGYGVPGYHGPGGAGGFSGHYAGGSWGGASHGGWGGGGGHGGGGGGHGGGGGGHGGGGGGHGGGR